MVGVEEGREFRFRGDLPSSYVSSCEIPLMPVVYQVVGFGRNWVSSTKRLNTGSRKQRQPVGLVQGL